MRTCGILMPVSSLDGPFGAGTMGREAYEFVDFLSQAGQGIWQILPLGPTGSGDSPYQSCSAFAGNPWLIDPRMLAEEGLLREEELKEAQAPNTGRADYRLLERTRLPLLRRAYRRFLEARPLPGCDTPYSDEYYRFFFLNQDWLEEYALYRAAQKENQGLPWNQWPAPLRTRQPQALEELKKRQGEEIGFWEFVEYLFWKQWRALRDYAASKGVRVLGDMPIYVSMDSADTWAGGPLFQTDGQGHPTRVAGCPPDYFSEDGQFWGNPLYDWSYHRQTGYDWWIRRIRHALDLYDLVRIDHFRAFDTYWSIPAGAATAREGRWEQGPGMDFFETLSQKLGSLPLVAEDLGEMFDSVRRLLAQTGLPGMKVLQFAFSSGPSNEYLPHNHIPNCLAYTGTHDNNTLRGWLEQEATREEIRFAMRYLNVKDRADLPRAILRAALGSCADTCILPLADWLELGCEGRINTPGVVGGNWNWRVKPGQTDRALARMIRVKCGLYGRCAPEMQALAAEK